MTCPALGHALSSAPSACLIRQALAVLAAACRVGYTRRWTRRPMPSNRLTFSSTHLVRAPVRSSRGCALAGARTLRHDEAPRKAKMTPLALLELAGRSSLILFGCEALWL